MTAKVTWPHEQIFPAGANMVTKMESVTTFCFT
jgi:hypothetical protein